MDENTNNGMVMPVSPYGGYSGGNGMFGGELAWIILFIALFAGGNWGNNGGNSGAGGMYPWLNQSDQINNGFRDQMLNNTVTEIQSGVINGFSGVQTALCNGFAGVANGFAQAEIAENARQLAYLQQLFNLQSSLQQCCCDNRAATNDPKYTIATEACADRAAAAANTQTILDKLCALELDAKNDRIAQLERELTMANLTASQGAQTAAILADNARQTSILNPTPVPAYIVQNPSGGYGAGCGCGVA